MIIGRRLLFNILSPSDCYFSWQNCASPPVFVSFVAGLLIICVGFLFLIRGIFFRLANCFKSIKGFFFVCIELLLLLFLLWIEFLFVALFTICCLLNAELNQLLC